MTLPSLGIDISKLKFDVCLSGPGGKFRHHVFPNSLAGFTQLCVWLSQQRVERAHACLEATGIYDEALATYLHEAGHLVSVVNPAAIKDTSTAVSVAIYATTPQRIKSRS